MDSGPVFERSFTKAPSKPMLLLLGVVYGLTGILIAYFLARSALGSLSVALTALGIVHLVQILFARHREISWAGGDPQEAASELTANLLALLFGVIGAYVIFAHVLDPAVIARYFAFQEQSVFGYRMGEIDAFTLQFGRGVLGGVIVLGLVILLSAIYKETGIALTIAWIGSLWGFAVVTMIRDGGEYTMPAIILTLVGLVALSAAFIAGGLTGLFLSRGAAKFPLRSPEFYAISRTSLTILMAGIGFILFSAAMSASSTIF